MTRQTSKEDQSLQNLAGTLFDLLSSASTTDFRFASGSRRRLAVIPVLLLRRDNGIDRQGEDAVDAAHFFATTLNVRGIHPARHRLTLFRRHRR